MENKNAEVLYKKVPSKSSVYTCMGTGNKCAIATNHFTKFSEMVKELSRTRSTLIFGYQERNLCIEEHCPIYNEIMAKIAEYAKGQSLQKG